MIVDFHTHIFPPWLRDQRERYLEKDSTFGELYANPKARMATADDLLQAMDEDGVDKSAAMGIGWTDYGLAREVNDYIIESARKANGRIVGFAGVNPAWGDEAVIETDRCANAGLQGIGELHPDSQRFDIGDETTMSPLMEVVRSHNLIVTTHASEPVGHIYRGKGKTTPEVLWRFIQNFPDVKIVCAHWGGGLPFYALMPEVAQSLEHVYFDTAASPFLYSSQIFRVVAGLVGADKILLGSDYSLLPARRLLSQLDESGLADDDKDKIKGGNAIALLGRHPNPTYRIRFFFDAGSGYCLWSGNEAAREKFGYPIALDELPLGQETMRRLNHMVQWHDTSYDWNDPAGDSPWDEDEYSRFRAAVDELLDDLRGELGPQFEIIDEFKL